MNPAATIFTSYLRKLPLEEQADLHRKMSGLVDHAGWQVFVDLIERAIDDNRRAIEWKGGLPEYEEFVANRGLLRGYQAALAVPDAVAETGRSADLELQRIAAQENHA